jgi:hypothetical protein
LVVIGWLVNILLQDRRRRPAGNLDSRLGVDAHCQQDERIEQPLNRRGVRGGTGGLQGLPRCRRQRRAEVFERLFEPPGVRRQRLPLDRDRGQFLSQGVGVKQGRGGETGQPHRSG